MSGKGGWLKTYHTRRAAGLCGMCGLVPSIPVRCMDCLLARAAKAEQKRAAGLCARCGTRPLAPGRSYCRECLAAAAGRTKTIHATRQAAGLCGLCGVRRPMYRRTACKVCKQQQRVRDAARRAKGVSP